MPSRISEIWSASMVSAPFTEETAERLGLFCGGAQPLAGLLHHLRPGAVDEVPVAELGGQLDDPLFGLAELAAEPRRIIGRHPAGERDRCLQRAGDDAQGL